MVSAESSMEPLETDSLSETQHQGCPTRPPQHCAGLGYRTAPQDPTELNFGPLLLFQISAHCFISTVRNAPPALPQHPKSRELVPSPNPRVTTQCCFPVTGTETATFPPAPNPSTYSSPWNPGWETHRSLEWKHRREAQCRVFPRMAHSLKRTQTMHMNTTPAFSLLPSPPPSSQPSQGWRQKQAPFPHPKTVNGVHQGLISAQSTRRT